MVLAIMSAASQVTRTKMKQWMRSHARAPVIHIKEDLTQGRVAGESHDMHSSLIIICNSNDSQTSLSISCHISREHIPCES